MSHPHITASGVLPHTLIYHHTEQEKRFVETCLRLIRDKDNGRILLSQLTRFMGGGCELKIKTTNTESTHSFPYLNRLGIRRNNVPDDPNDPRYQNALDRNIHFQTMRNGRSHGPGASTEIHFNPNESRVIDEYGIGTRITSHDTAYISLAHELIHALHTAKGERLRDNPHDPFTDLEEDRAIGIMDYEGMPITENSIRSDHNLPLRSTRFDQNEAEPLMKKYIPVLF